MCLPKPPKPPQQQQVAEVIPAPPPEPTPEAPILSNEGAGRSAASSTAKAKKSGTRSLQIDLNVPGGFGGGNGLSIST